MKIAAVLALLVGLGSALANELQDYHFNINPPPGFNLPPEPPEDPTRRIFGGQKAADGQFPFIVYAVLSTSMCTGSLIKFEWVLLAAHCVPKYLKVGWDTYVLGGRANLYPWYKLRGKKNLQPNETWFGIIEREVDAYYVHPAFDRESLLHDMALLELEESMETPFTATVPLSLERMTSIMMCTLTGYGRLPDVKYNLQLYQVANMRSGAWPLGCSRRKKQGFVCVLANRKKGVCVGDSGSPLLCNGKVWGVCSHYRSVKPFCGNAEEIYYAQVYQELHWIMSLSGSRKIEASLRAAFVFGGGAWFVTLAVEVLIFSF